MDVTHNKLRIDHVCGNGVGMTDDGTKQPESRGLSRSAFGPLLLAILGLALGESLAGWILAGQAGLPMGGRFSLVYFTFSCLLCSCLIPAYLLARILDSEAVRSLAEGYRQACVGRDPGLHLHRDAPPLRRWVLRRMLRRLLRDHRVRTPEGLLGRA